jgi:hypothetical protein
MSFGIAVGKLGLERDVNRSTAEVQDTADWDTISPVAQVVADHLTHHLLHTVLGWTDLRFRWLFKDTDELRQAEILTAQYETNAITINELRDVWDREPMPDEWGTLTRSQYESRAAMLGVDTERLGGPPRAEDRGEDGDEGDGDGNIDTQ